MCKQKDCFSFWNWEDRLQLYIAREIYPRLREIYLIFRVEFREQFFQIYIKSRPIQLIYSAVQKKWDTKILHQFQSILVSEGGAGLKDESKKSLIMLQFLSYCSFPLLIPISGATPWPGHFAPQIWNKFILYLKIFFLGSRQIRVYKI